MNEASAIRFEPARAEHADIFLAMMGALEAADPGTTPFDEPRRRAIFQEFVRDKTYGQAWLILEDGVAVGEAGTHGPPDEQGDVESGGGRCDSPRAPHGNAV